MNKKFNINLDNIRDIVNKDSQGENKELFLLLTNVIEYLRSELKKKNNGNDSDDNKKVKQLNNQKTIKTNKVKMEKGQNKKWKKSSKKEDLKL